MGKIHIYEGKLPEAVARDFEFKTVYRSSYYAQADNSSGSKEDAVKSAKSNEGLFNKVLDCAVENLVSLAQNKKFGLSDTEIIADVNIIRKVYGSKIYDSLNPSLYSGTLDITVEAIGYKQKERKSE